jgi:hypothetical protein
MGLFGEETGPFRGEVSSEGDEEDCVLCENFFEVE